MTNVIPSQPPFETPEEEAARNERNAKLPPGALPEPSPADLISGVRQVAHDLINMGITEPNGRLTNQGLLYFAGREHYFIDAEGNLTEKGKKFFAEMEGGHPDSNA